MLLTAGMAGTLLHALYAVLDREASSRLQRAVRTCMQPLRWLGLNAIICFFGDELLSQALPCVFWRTRNMNLITWLFGGFVWAFGDLRYGAAGFCSRGLGVLDHCRWPAVQKTLLLQDLIGLVTQALPCVFWRTSGRNLISCLFGGLLWAFRELRYAHLAFKSADCCCWLDV